MSLSPTRRMDDPGKTTIYRSMESVGPNSPAASYDRVGDRIVRALTHRIALLHRAGQGKFYVLGATGNVYAVTLSGSPSCTCPDRVSPCKHLLFVLLRVLGLPLDDPCVYRRQLTPCQLARATSAPTAEGVMAGPRAVERFHQVFGDGGATMTVESGGARRDEVTCPVCLEEMVVAVGGGDVATCSTCGNSVHGECLRRWKRSRGRRAASCVVCRARWRENRVVERYVNLGGYVDVEMNERGCGLCSR